MITLAIQCMGEATALTASYGLKAADVLDIITNTVFTCPSYQRYGAYIATDTYVPGFPLALGLNDVNLALDATKARQANLPALQLVHDTMTDAMAQGLGAHDWSNLAEVTQRRASGGGGGRG